MVERAQFSPSVGGKNLDELVASRKSVQKVISSVGGPGAVSGSPRSPRPDPEPMLAESDAAKENRLSNAEKALEQQRELNSLTPSVRRAATADLSGQESIREVLGDFLEESLADATEPAGEGGPISGEISVPELPELNMPGSGGSGVDVAPIQTAESSPAPAVPEVRPPPQATGDSGSDGGDLSGPRGEVVDVVS